MGARLKKYCLLSNTSQPPPQKRANLTVNYCKTIKSWNAKFSGYLWNTLGIIYQCFLNLHDCTCQLINLKFQIPKYLETIHYPNFADLIKFNKVSVLHEKTIEIENFSFVGCYATWSKDSIYAVTIISVQILVIHIQIFITMKASFSLKGTQQSCLILNQMNKRKSFLGKTFYKGQIFWWK